MMEQVIPPNIKLDFELIFRTLPGLYILLSPDLRILAATDSYCRAANTTEAQLKGKTIQEAFSSAPPSFNAATLRQIQASLQAVLERKEPQTIKPVRFDINPAQESYWEATNTPMLNTHGHVQYIAHEARDITEQVLAEREAQVSLESLDLMSLTANGTMWNCELQKGTISWSDSYTKLFGYDGQNTSFEAENWFKFVHPEDVDLVRQSFRKHLEERDSTFNVEYRFKRADGTYADVLSHGHILYSASRQPLRLVGSAADISKQKHYKRQLEDISERFKHIATATNDVIWDWNLADNTVWWNEGYKTLFGYTEEEIDPTSESWTSFIHPEDLAKVSGSIHQAISGGKDTWQHEYRFRCADNTYKLVLDRGFVIHDSHGHATRMVGAMVDITDKRRVELELQENQERFERVAMATNDVVWDWNIRTNAHWVNEGFKVLFGYKDEDITPTLETCTSRIHPDESGRVTLSVQQALENDQELWEQEYRFRCADGSYKLIQDKGYIIRDSQGKPIRMIGAMRDVTEKRQFELQLQESTARITQILETLPLMTWTATAEGSVNYYNNRWYEFTGAAFEDLRDWGWDDFIHPDDFEQTSKRWLHSIATGEVFSAENRWKSAKDGSYRWFLARAVPIHDSKGHISLWVGSHTDIEEQKQSLLALKESNDKFKLLAESIPHIVWSGQPDGHVDYFNQQWYGYTKMTEEETLGFGWAPTLHPDDLQPTTEDWLHSMRSGKKYERELRLRNIYTDDYRWFLARAVPIRNAEGDIIKWFGTATDIHEQKVLQEQVQESEKRFRFLTESIPQMVWTASADGATDYFNSRWLSFTGLSLKESQGHEAWLKALHPDDHETALKRWQHSVHTGDYYEVEYRIKNGSLGTYRWFLGQAMPMCDENGKIIKWFGTCTDIEDHKKAEEELVEKNLELERINQDLDSFVYTASHDLKLPVVNMAGIFAELTRNAEFNDPDAPRLIEMFDNSLAQLHSTIYDLGEIVRIQKTKDRELKSLSLQETTQDVLMSLQDMVQETGASVHFDYSKAPHVAFTRAGLKSILYNLIVNAIKYRDLSRTPEIRLHSKTTGNYVEVVIADNGLGIDMAKHENKLFQMFKRFHSHVKGSGLGLYIVNRLISNHGGYINIESTLNKGTTFHLFFKQKKS